MPESPELPDEALGLLVSLERLAENLADGTAIDGDGQVAWFRRHRVTRTTTYGVSVSRSG